jgi:hypothetical protein
MGRRGGERIQIALVNSNTCTKRRQLRINCRGEILNNLASAGGEINGTEAHQANQKGPWHKEN